MLGIKGYISIEEINKGWSKDKKYLATDKNGNKHLIRTSQLSNLEKKKEEFKIVNKIYELGIFMNKPLEFGICDDNENCYMILTWLDGEDARSVLKKLPNKKQYEIGYDAGKILRKIHSIMPPQELEPWDIFFNGKMNKKTENYINCPIKIENGDKLLKYIDKNRHLLENRPQTLHHGDFHMGNMIINDNLDLGIIDFNSWDYGDPYEEFNRIVFCADSSKHFASGRINGYFNDQIPNDFFDLMALYIASNTLSAVPWAMDFGQTEIDFMLNQAKNVLSWYGNMENTVPSWYMAKAD